MSLELDGVWKAGVWATTVWGANVWREGVVAVIMPPVIRRVIASAEVRTEAVRREQRRFNMAGEDRIIEVKNDIH